MSNEEKADTCIPGTQETYCEESVNDKTCSETQSTGLNESQDFRLVDFGEDSLKTQSSGEDNCQKPVKEPDLQQTSDAPESKTDEQTIAASDNKVESEEKVAEDKTTEGKLVEKSVVANDELTDNEEDEIVQGTPPHSYTPPKKADGDIEGASLKRKAGSFDEPLAKVPRTTSMDDAVKEQLAEEEESRQSCKSDDSYEELFNTTQRNVIIEETQDPTSESTQNSLQSPKAPTETMDGDKERQEDGEKDENLNVSAKLADTSANDATSIVANANSLPESDARVNEREAKETVTSFGAATEDTDKKLKPETDTSNEKETEEKSPTEVKDAVTDAVAADEAVHTTDSTNCVEKIAEPEKPAEEDDDEIPPSQQPTKVSEDSPSCLKPASSCKLHTSVELLYDGTGRTVADDEGERKPPEVVEIADDTERSILESSAEVIYEPTSNEKKSKPEVVNIDDSHEDRERIVLDRLDSNSEVTAREKGTREDTNETVYKSCYDSKSDFSYKSALEHNKGALSLDSRADSNKLVNGSDDSKGSDKTVSVDSLSGYETSPAVLGRGDNAAAALSSRKLAAKGLLGSKDLDNIELISISDHEQDVSNTDDGVRKSDLIHNSAPVKAVQVEKEIGMYVRFRCLLQIDENTKEFLGKELTAVHCEPIIESSLMRQKNDDTASSSLADISDNKETSPGSVNSNPQPYALNPRLSTMSSVSSSSSASSASSLMAKLALKDHVTFSLPRGPAKHAKKLSQDVPLSTSEKQSLDDETYERLTREWANNRLLTTTLLNCANTELSALDTDNIGNERLDDHHLRKMRSSTPEVATDSIELTATPKSTKKNKSLKRPRSKMTRSRVAHANGESKSNATGTPSTVAEDDDNTPRKRSKTETSSVASDSAEGSKLVISGAHVLANSSPLPVDDLIGRKVFAKWSDNNYYPGMVTDRVKAKYKVNFYDGKSKVLIPEFVIPIPKTLREGLSVYATTQTNDYSSGIIVDVKYGKDADEGDDVRYTVETDDNERLHVQVKDLFLSADQAQLLKEEVDPESKSVPSTPKHLGQVTLDNMVEGKRRSKRIGTPVFSTPKSRNITSSNSSGKIKSEPSSSGMSARMKKRSTASENESDANAEPPVQDEYALLGVQKEIIGTPHAQVVKGPMSRLKNKRSKKRQDDKETIVTLGPIPTDDTIFQGMSFILTCASLESLDRYEDAAPINSGTEETETDNEQEWTQRPFVRDRLHTQILAGGGKVYEDFNDVPKAEYAKTKLITNVPNTTAKSILCLSLGIPAYNHKWIIRCCTEVNIGVVSCRAVCARSARRLYLVEFARFHRDIDRVLMRLNQSLKLYVRVYIYIYTGYPRSFGIEQL